MPHCPYLCKCQLLLRVQILYIQVFRSMHGLYCRAPITATELCHCHMQPCHCFKITNGLMVTSLRSLIPVLQLSSEGRLYLWCVWVVLYIIHSIIINLTMFKEIFNVWYVIVTIYQSLPFSMRLSKSSLVFVVKSVLEIQYLTEGPYRCTTVEVRSLHTP